ncbi:hypothetical protein C8R43DRAFT_1159307 [Mycena crocata]|nr:hypothetical protein C8R43DRAFT_1159307 [Mycena crocata]
MVNKKPSLAGLPVPTSYNADSDKRKARRGLRAFGICAFAVTTWLCVRYNHLDPSRTVPVHTLPATSHLPKPWPIPPDLEVDHCADWSDVGDSDGAFPYFAQAAIELPLSSQRYFLLSRRLADSQLISTGLVNYAQSDEPAGSVNVQVTAYFWREEHLAAGKACRLTREEDGTGVGIFTNWEKEERRNRNEKLRFHVTVTFPKTLNESILEIDKLSTDLEVFSQNFSHLSNIFFRFLILRVAIGEIHADALVTENAHRDINWGDYHTVIGNRVFVRSGFGAVGGTFNSSSVIFLRTGSGVITGTINLISSSSKESKFHVTALSSNAGIELNVQTAPVDSKVLLRAETTIGTVVVKLPSTYEGLFTAATTFSSPVSVSVGKTIEDPSGRERNRSVEYEQANKGFVRGKIGWSEEGQTRGSVDLKTTMSPVTLEF